MDKLILTGNLGADPEMRYVPSGKAVTNFSVACNRRWTNADGEAQEQTVWYRVSAWGRLAEVCNEYLRKGRQVLIEARLKPDPDTGGPRVFERKDGSFGASYEITASKVEFLGNRGDTGAAPSEAEAPATPEEGEIPF